MKIQMQSLWFWFAKQFSSSCLPEFHASPQAAHTWRILCFGIYIVYIFLYSICTFCCMFVCIEFSMWRLPLPLLCCPKTKILLNAGSGTASNWSCLPACLPAGAITSRKFLLLPSTSLLAVLLLAFKCCPSLQPVFCYPSLSLSLLCSCFPLYLAFSAWHNEFVNFSRFTTTLSVI